MTYTEVSCPHCHATVASGRILPNDVGRPYLTCPYCKSMLKCEDMCREWAMRTKAERIKFLLSVPWMGSLLVTLFFVLLLAYEDVEPVMIIVLGIFFFLVSLYIMYLGWKRKWKEKIKESIIRTQNEEYVKFLNDIGYKTYDISDNEVYSFTGCEKEEFSNIVANKEKEEKKKTEKREKLKEKLNYTLNKIYGYGDCEDKEKIDVNKIVYTFKNNKEFLNEIFNMGLEKPLRTSRYTIDEEIEIWIVRFDNKERNNYRNYFSEDENLVHEVMSSPENRKKYKKRIVVEKHVLSNTIYEIKGIYERDEGLCSECENVYKKTNEDVVKYLNTDSFYVKGFFS